MPGTDPSDMQSTSNGPEQGVMYVYASSPIHIEGRRWLTYASVRPLPFRITVAE